MLAAAGILPPGSFGLSTLLLAAALGALLTVAVFIALWRTSRAR